MVYRQKKSIFKTIFFPILALLILQSLIFCLYTIDGGVVGSLNQNSRDILKEKNDNRSNEIAAIFNNKWANFYQYETKINELYQNPDFAGIKNNAELQKEFLSELSDTMVLMLRENEVNGVFFIFNNADSLDEISEKDAVANGVCIRDYDTESLYTEREDLLVLRSPSSVAHKINCSLESGWEPAYTFENVEEAKYYYEPLKAAFKNPDVESDNLSYFCGVHSFYKNDNKVISYSIPIICDGIPIGVLGIEVTQKAIEALIPSEELLGSNVGAYALIQYQDDSDYTIIKSNGILFDRNFDNEGVIPKGSSLDKGMIQYKLDNGVNLVGTLSNINVYNKNTPFEKEKLGLLCIVKQENLYKLSNNVSRQMIFISLVVLIIGCVGILLISRIFSRPIKRLAEKVKSMGDQSELKLEHIGIEEIDELINSIQKLSNDIGQNQVRTEFFSRMSHDMRTPMNAIIGFSSNELLEKATPEEKDAYLLKINSSGKYLLGLINEVLDMTKIESNKMKIVKDDLNLSETWDEISEIISVLAKEKNVNYITDIDAYDGEVYGDRQRMCQVFVNLLSNAVKFTKEGGEVDFIVKNTELTDKTLKQTITIRDNGIGMSKEFAKEMFEPFAQEHSNYEGTGLGLSIVKKIVDLMEGELNVKTKLGEGTEFTVTLTYEKDFENVDQNNSLQENKDIHMETLKGKRILVCEDNELNQEIARRLLQTKGMEVEVAENGKLGLDRFSETESGYFDVILMDVRMPVMDGLEATRKIRQLQREDALTIPIIAMTANAFTEDKKETKSAGMTAHLSKPVEPEKLFNVLCKYLR